MTSILRKRLVEAAEHISESRQTIEMRIDVMFVRIIIISGFYSAHRLVPWDVIEDSTSTGNPLIFAIEQAKIQIRKKKGVDHDTSMGL